MKLAIDKNTIATIIKISEDYQIPKTQVLSDFIATEDQLHTNAIYLKNNLNIDYLQPTINITALTMLREKYFAKTNIKND